MRRSHLQSLLRAIEEGTCESLPIVPERPGKQIRVAEHERTADAQRDARGRLHRR